MKQFAIITWPRPHVSQEVIEKIITADGWIITETHKGNPETKWNPLKKDVIIFLVEINSPLRLKDIVGELSKHCCEAVRGIENHEEISKTVSAFHKKRSKR